jgi:hypothetical protein
MTFFCFVFGEQSPMQFRKGGVSLLVFIKVEDSISFPCTLFVVILVGVKIQSSKPQLVIATLF